MWVLECQTPTDHALQDHTRHCGHTPQRLSDTSMMDFKKKILALLEIQANSCLQWLLISASFLIQFITGIPCQPGWLKLSVWYPSNSSSPIKLSGLAMQVHSCEILKLCCWEICGLWAAWLWVEERKRTGQNYPFFLAFYQLPYYSDFPILLTLSHDATPAL